MFSHQERVLLARELSLRGFNALNDINTWLRQTSAASKLNSIQMVKESSELFSLISLENMLDANERLLNMNIRTQGYLEKHQIISFYRQDDGYFRLEGEEGVEVVIFNTPTLDYLRFMHQRESSQKGWMLTIKDYLVLIEAIRWFDILCEGSFDRFYDAHRLLLNKPYRLIQSA